MAKPKLKLSIVEVEKIHGAPDMDAGSAAAVASLQMHPGFLWLLASLRFQASALKTALYKTRQKSLGDVEFLQSGINWAGWLQDQLDKAVKITQKPAPREAKPFEIDQFEHLLSQIDVVGAEPTADNS